MNYNKLNQLILQFYKLATSGVWWKGRDDIKQKPDGSWLLAGEEFTSVDLNYGASKRNWQGFVDIGVNKKIIFEAAKVGTKPENFVEWLKQNQTPYIEPEPELADENQDGKLSDDEAGKIFDDLMFYEEYAKLFILNENPNIDPDWQGIKIGAPKCSNTNICLKNKIEFSGPDSCYLVEENGVVGLLDTYIGGGIVPIDEHRDLYNLLRIQIDDNKSMNKNEAISFFKQINKLPFVKILKGHF